MARILIITNPTAARTSERGLAAVRRVFRDARWTPDVAATTAAGQAVEFARQAVADHFDLVAVYGGDGTVTEAVTGLRGSGIPVVLIPGGTGNVLAGNLRLPRDPARAAAAAVSGKPRALDLGRCRANGATHFFTVSCGSGFDAELMSQTPSRMKRRWRMAAYFGRGLQLAMKVKNCGYRITVDGHVHELPAANVTVANCEEVVPPLIPFRRGARLDDGLLDVVVISANGLLDSVLALKRMLFSGGLSGG
ncbi:MAG: diacylglycerol/lipid kinase family protein, partial [Gemmatimonadales bacterium]